MFRGQRLVNMMIEKDVMDNNLMSIDRSEWYYIDKSRVPLEMLNKFHQFYIEREVDKFLEDSLKTSNSICLQLYYTLMSSLLSFVIAKTSINGLLDRGGMHLFSVRQLQEFMDLKPDRISHDKNILDLGAGDGRITDVLFQLYRNVSVTEASELMRWRLQRRGFTVLPIDSWHNNGPFQLVSALNLLDRHFNPKLLLQQLHHVTIRSHSNLLLAVVLPLQQYVEFHPNSKSTRPDEILKIEGRTFEEQAASLVANVLEPAGFELIKWGKLPYLCEGDLKMPYYHLDDAVFLLRPVETVWVAPQNTTESVISNRDHISL